MSASVRSWQTELILWGMPNLDVTFCGLGIGRLPSNEDAENPAYLLGEKDAGGAWPYSGPQYTEFTTQVTVTERLGMHDVRMEIGTPTMGRPRTDRDKTGQEAAHASSALLNDTV